MREQCLRLLERRARRCWPSASRCSDRIVGPARRARAGARRPARELFPELADAAAAAQPGGALPARVHAHARARARDAPRAPTAATPTPARAARRPARRRAVAARRRRRRSSPRGDLHDVIRQVEVFGFHFARLDIREHADAPPRRADRDPVATLGVARGLRGAATRPSASPCCAREIADRRPLIPADIARLLGRHAGGRSRRSACSATLLAGAAPRRGADATSSPAPRARPTCSRCCC